MKKKLLSVILALAMVLSLMPVAFAAEADTATSSNDLVPFEDKAAENVVTETEVKTADELKTAIDKASLIVLKNSITLTDKLVVDKPVTIDGKGNTITGTVHLKDGTLKNMTITSKTNQLLTIGSDRENKIRMENVTVKYSVTERAGGSAQTVSGNKADIVITGCRFVNEPNNDGQTVNAQQWSYGLYINSQADEGSIQFVDNEFNGAFRTMLPSISGNVTIQDNKFVNSVYSVANGPTSGAGAEATCITTARPSANDNFVITGNTFDNAGSFYFQQTEKIDVCSNVFNFDTFENYIQTSGETKCPLDLTENSFVLGENDLVIIDKISAPVKLPTGQRAVNYWPWYKTPDDIKPNDYSSYGYAYNADGSVTFYPGSEGALVAFLNPNEGNIGVRLGDVINLTQDITLNKAIPLDRSVTINGNNRVLSSVDNTQDLQGCIFTIQKPDITVKLDRVNLLIQTENAKPFYFTQNNGSMNLEMTNSKISCASDKNAYLINLVQGGKVKYNFVGNEVNVPARGLLVSIANGSVIKDNVIDLQGEKSPTGRSGIMSLVAEKGGEPVTITSNTFKNANRALGVDHSDLETAKLTYNQNKFLNVRFALEFDPRTEGANAGTGIYDLKKNYYSFDGMVSAPKVEDASSNGDHLTGATEYKPEGESRVDNSVYYVAETMRDPQDLNNYTPSSGGPSSGSSGNKTETTTNPDGSTTTTVTKPDGSKTETTKYPDGSKEVVETKKDGTTTTTTTDKEGNKTETVEKPDGSSVTKVDNKDGSGSTTTVSKDGETETTVRVPRSMIEEAGDDAVQLQMPEAEAAKDANKAPSITVDLPSGETAKVEIPVKDVTAGTVAILVKEDGTEEIIKTTVMGENGVIVTLSDGDTVKIVDNSKDFADVSDSAWYADAIDFVTSRELFNGTSDTMFSPGVAMTRGMIVTVLARLDGEDTTDGATWYEAERQWAMENGISDGSNMMNKLTREQLVTMLYCYAQYRGLDTATTEENLTSFADAAQVSGYAVSAMNWAVGAGVINGTDSGLAPKATATRAEVAQILMNFDQKF